MLIVFHLPVDAKPARKCAESYTPALVLEQLQACDTVNPLRRRAVP